MQQQAQGRHYDQARQTKEGRGRTSFDNGVRHCEQELIIFPGEPTRANGAQYRVAGLLSEEIAAPIREEESLNLPA